MKKMARILGIIVMSAVMVIGFTACGGDLPGGGDNVEQYSNTPDDPYNNWSYNERWGKNDDEETTVDYSIDNGIVTVNVTGTKSPNIWTSRVYYRYTAHAGRRYAFLINGKVVSPPVGERTLHAQYFNDYENDTYIGCNITIPAGEWVDRSFVGDPIPYTRDESLGFQCANELGTFDLKVHAIIDVTNNYNLPNNFQITSWTGTFGAINIWLSINDEWRWSLGNYTGEEMNANGVYTLTSATTAEIRTYDGDVVGTGVLSNSNNTLTMTITQQVEGSPFSAGTEIEFTKQVF